jgi:putative tricarboxylic transport membrane protein
MTIRRDHVAGVMLVLLGAAVLTLGWHLPFGTPASPGPGMLPFLVVGLMMALAALLILQAGSSPPLATIEWTDVPHALRVIAVAAAAATLYEPVGFIITMGLMMFVLMFLIERQRLFRSAIVASCVTVGAYLLIAELLKTPLPMGVLGY